MQRKGLRCCTDADMLHGMPTLNPRVTVTLTPASAAVLRELCQLTGNSQSATVAELLDTALPVLERVCAALRAASTVQEAARTEIAAGLERAQTKIEAQLQIALGDMDDGFRPFLDHAEKVARRGPRAVDVRIAHVPAPAPRKRSTPVLVTRGSHPPSKPPKGTNRGGV